MNQTDRSHDPDAPSGAQNWENFAEDVDDRYARHGDLEEHLLALDTRLDLESKEAVAQIGRLDKLAQVTLSELYFDAREREAHFEEALYAVLAMACWNQARRMGGHPDMIGGVQKARDGSTPPFASPAAAWAFTIEACCTIGAGPLTSVVAETSTLALAMGRAAEVRGRARGKDRQGGDVGGFLPVEWMASSPTHAGGSSAKGEGAVLLRADVNAAIARAVPKEDRYGLELVLLGEERRVPRAREQGNKFRSHGQYERVRLTMREAAALVRAHALHRLERGYEGASEPASEEAIKKRIGRAKDALQEELERRGLVPAPRPRPIRAESATSGPKRISAFAEGWS